LDFSLLTPAFILFLIVIGVGIGVEIGIGIEIGVEIGILRPLDSAKSFLESESESQSE
jgi:hypothetical protein